MKKLDLASINIPAKTLIEMYEQMVFIRRVEEKIVEVYAEQEMRCPTHLSIGQEACAVGVCSALDRRNDRIFSTHRCHAHYLAKGGALRPMFAELYGKRTGCTRGKGGSMHLTDESVGMMGTSAIVGQSIPLAVGAAMAANMKRTSGVAVAFFGDAGVEQGVFHESLNFSALRKLPVIFVCENNFYATQTHQSKRQVKDKIYKHGEIYGIPGERIDGNDVLAVYTAALKAIRRARKGEGPSLLELRTYRWREHVGPNYDWDLGYRTKEEVASWIKKCPVETWGKRLLAIGLFKDAQIKSLNKRINQTVLTALAQAKSDPFPEPDELFEFVY